MRLIDADKLKQYIDDCVCCEKCEQNYFKCYEHCELPDCVTPQWERVLNEQQPVDAIPIEFIKSEIARMKEGLNPHHPECAIYAEDLGILIEEWEGSKKEYETD